MSRSDPLRRRASWRSPSPEPMRLRPRTQTRIQCGGSWLKPPRAGLYHRGERVSIVVASVDLWAHNALATEPSLLRRWEPPFALDALSRGKTVPFKLAFYGVRTSTP